jgi:hypothetical protein
MYINKFHVWDGQRATQCFEKPSVKQISMENYRHAGQAHGTGIFVKSSSLQKEKKKLTMIHKNV